MYLFALLGIILDSLSDSGVCCEAHQEIDKVVVACHYGAAVNHIESFFDDDDIRDDKEVIFGQDDNGRYEMKAISYRNEIGVRQEYPVEKRVLSKVGLLCMEDAYYDLCGRIVDLS